MKEQKNNKPTSQFIKTDGGKTKSNAIEVPSVSLPKGGGAIKGIDEKFSVNAVNGTASFSLPLPITQARGVTPSLSLSYNSGSGNSIFGLGWNLHLPSIKRKTDKGLPRYSDTDDSDTFLFSEAEDLVPEFRKDNNHVFLTDGRGDYIIKEKDSADNLFHIRFYRPRTEGLFARIERWQKKDGGEISWRVITKDNITTLFGWSANARIAEPNKPSKIFEWLPEFVFDDKGNCCRYKYKPEDNVNLDTSAVHNYNRIKNGSITYTNCYLEKIFYGNKTPYKNFGAAEPAENDYLFETVFDYGQSNIDAGFNNANWYQRPDAFSDYKAGFEIRTTRLCRRVLLFHHFADNEYNGLVKALEIGFDTASEDDFTFLSSAALVGYIKKQDGTYSSKRMPPVEFTYQKHEWKTDVKTVAPNDIVHAPTGIENSSYQFVDLYNEGLSGILTEQAGGWFYKQNLGDGHFKQAKLITPKPSLAGLNNGLQLADLDADGGKQLVSYKNEPKGFFEINDNSEWQQFQNFKSLPNISFDSPYTRLLDLNGDGKADILISEENVFTCYESDGREGFEKMYKTSRPYDEEAGPDIVFADGQQTIFIADMSGDGLGDIVKIKNGQVCYWPNLGYGKFGTKVTMGHAPVFDSQDAFNPSYIKLADIDGSGTTDIIYLGKNKFSCWKNLSGNRFATTPFEITAFPDIHPSATISVTDLLGNGVSCIVWSGNLQKDATSPLKYIDLMNSKKPHLMVAYKNNMGKEVAMEYKPSTHYYLLDRNAGKPWITRLHFPVHCIAKTTTEDKITGHKFTTEYAYHHGYYDHAEREFRGFGMVEQTDAETFEHWKKSGASNITDASLHQEPVFTKQWVHTGAFLQKEKILTHFVHEYWHEEIQRHGFAVVHHEQPLPDAILVPAGGIPASVVNNLSAAEWQQALRACKGMTLRTEVFAKDALQYGNTSAAIKKQLTPYTVATHNCRIELLQPKGKNKYAVFLVKESEAITYSYERNPEDPRIAHTLNLKSDKYGNVEESASVVYPRLTADTSLPQLIQDAQKKTNIIFTKNSFTNDINDDIAAPHVLRLPQTSETKSYELKGVIKTGRYYSLKDFDNILTAAKSDKAEYHEIEKPLTAGKAQWRLVEHMRNIFYNNNCKDALPPGQLHSLALPYESYQLAYTPELIEDIFGKPNIPNAKITDAILQNEGKFTHSGDANWWVRSGTKQFVLAGETLADAQNRFYLPISFTEPFGAVTKVKYKSPYHLFIEEVEDELLNKSTVALFNFRTLAPQRMQDINGNLSEAISDELGIIKATAIMGKGNQADELTALTEITDTAERNLVRNFFNLPLTPEGVTDSGTLKLIGKQLLQRASTRFVYDFDVYLNTGRPNSIAGIIREQHYHSPDGTINPLGSNNADGSNNDDYKLQMSFEFSDGHGEVVMKKVQAEPGEAKKIVVTATNVIAVTAVNTKRLVNTPLRWLGNGKTIKNNKGNVVKQYEPYFSVNNLYENYKELTETGVTPIMYYDAAGRLVKTEMPDGTFSKVEFDAWKQKMYDANDTVKDSDWYKQRTDSTRTDFIIDAKEQEAAAKALLHYDTPNQLHFDTLGKPVLSIDHNRNISTAADEFYKTKIVLDIEGNLRKVVDARELPENSHEGNTVMQYKYDMLGNLVYHNSMDAGQRWLLTNIMGNPLRTWDERGHEFQYYYDVLHRPTESKVIGGDSGTALNNIFGKIMYGENLLATETRAALEGKNVLGKIVKNYDTAGLVETNEYDFKGQPKATTRKLFTRYKDIVDWNVINAAADLEADVLTFSTETDAIGRITRQTAPDGSIITPAYNEAGLLNSESVLHPGEGTADTYIKDIDYNERGQREKIIYGNNVSTKFYYDKNTFRLTRLETKRHNNNPLQDWYYTYDAAGNITHIEDNNIPTRFFDNVKHTGLSTYTYDALYRLKEATGRENSAALSFGKSDNWNDAPYFRTHDANDEMAVRHYTQTYLYDAVGNIEQMKHRADGTGNNWTRDYVYEKLNNRLLSTQVGVDIYNYTTHAQHGFIKSMPHLDEMGWSFKEELVKTIQQRRTDGGTAEATYYQYDSGGQRIRKITENAAAPGALITKKDERIYVSGYELYKKHSGPHAGLKRSGLSLMDEGHRFVMVETRSDDVNDGTQKKLVRYKLHNHLGSAALELDDAAEVISYEEYHPFGTTAYQAKNNAIKSAAKRYRYTGMERDEETGLEYHSARYYLPWLGRWLSADPIGIGDGVNVYAFVHNNPISNIDSEGTQSKNWQNDLSAGEKFALWVSEIDETNKMQTVANYSAGLGDYLSFGLTDKVRNKMGTNSVVDKDSGAYNYGQASGVVLQFATGAGAVPGAVTRFGAAATVKGMVGGAIAMGGVNEVADAIDPSQTASGVINTVASYVVPLAARPIPPSGNIKTPSLKIPNPIPNFEMIPGDVVSMAMVASEPIVIPSVSISVPALAVASANTANASTSLAVATTGGGGGGRSNPPKPKKTHKGAATEILKANQDKKSNQTILTAKIKLNNGEEMNVAIPNTPFNGKDPAWRPGQMEAAQKMGYTPLDTPKNSVPGLHAEENLGAALKDMGGGSVLEWAISRGGDATSFICKSATCRVMTNNWGPQQFK